MRELRTAVGVVAMRRVVVTAFAVALMFVVGVSSAQATKYYGSFFGSTSGSPALGGTFNNPLDAAVNEATDDLYVADSSNNRIQRFSASGVFELAWGRDVVQTGGTGDVSTTAFEVCTVAAECKAGTTGAEGGMLSNPQGVEVDQDTGDVYVTDRGNNRVQRFDADGVFERAFGSDVDLPAGGTAGEICTAAANCKAGAAGAGAGQFGAALGRLAVSQPDGNPATGSVFVGDATNRRLAQYDLDGTFGRAWGVGVATGAAHKFEICTTTCAAGVPGNTAVPNQLNGAFNNNQPLHVAVDSEGVVYAADSTAGTSARVLQFDSTATSAAELLVYPINVLNLVGGVPAVGGISNLGLEVNPDSDGPGADVDRLLVGRGGSGVSTVFELTFGDDHNADMPEIADTHVLGSGVTANGLGFNAGLGLLYTPSTTGAHRVYVADDDGVAGAPISTVDPVTGITDDSASVAGTVNPNGPAGFPSSYRFEYSKNGVSWTPAGAEQTLNDGTSPIAVSASLSGLEANTLYRVRIAARRAFGNPYYYSPEAIFLTDSLPPDVETAHPRYLTATSAELAGRVDPGGRSTTYYFEYGETLAYGSKAPVPSGEVTGTGSKAVVQRLTGLTPQTTYHYRLVAENADGAAEGQDVTFVTPAVGGGAPVRTPELVTPPYKATLALGPIGSQSGGSSNPVQPSVDGERLFWAVPTFPFSDDQVHPFDGDRLQFDRSSDGWHAHSHFSLFPDDPGFDSFNDRAVGYTGLSGDLSAQTMTFPTALLPNESANPQRLYTRREGIGTEGYTGWLRNVSTQQVGIEDKALFNDDGSFMTRWGRYRGVVDDPDTPAAEDPSVTQLAGAGGGSTVYLQENPPTGERDLVNECTGSVGVDATQIPERFDNGTPATADDLIDSQDCAAGTVTDRRGAVLGANSSSNTASIQGPAATAMSDDGRRVFFMSPDPSASGVSTSCGTTVGTATACPPQLFVRQYDENGENPVVRWISRSAAGMPAQQIGLLGRGAIFEGASRDGRYVYFRTNAPLTADDRNGTGAPGPVTTGTASNSSWDLYRYELPEDLDDDPSDGTLTRISAGPTGDADPSTNGTGGSGAAARYISDDGKRAYFVTGAPIAGADSSPPESGTGGPGGAAANTVTRNLYLFDDDEVGSARWKFIAQLPFSESTSDGATAIARCGTHHLLPGGIIGSSGFSVGAGPAAQEASCVRGTPSGRALLFMTIARLAVDDVDTAADIYVYLRDGDELVRVSAPPPGAQSYACVQKVTNSFLAPELMGQCNADVGWRTPELPLDTARGWGGGRSYNVAEDGDGEISVFFESRSELVPEDTNGDHWDTYQWRAGELTLISPGDSADDSYYSGNSVDGEDVFVQTTARVDSRDIGDSDIDIYDYRVDGGFPASVSPVFCEVLGDRCQDAGEAPTGTDVRTDESGGGNASPPLRVELTLATLSRAQLRRAARVGVLRLRVRSSSAGRVRAVARAKLGRRGRRVAGATARLSRPGSATLRLRLSRAARQRLGQRKPLRLSVVASTPGGRARTMNIVLRRTER